MLRLPPGLVGRKGRVNGNPVVVPKGTVPMAQDGMGWDEMGDAGERTLQQRGT